MPVSLARRIRRIGLLLSTKDEKGNRVHNFDPNYLEPESRAICIAALKADAKEARIAARATQKTAVAKHKASIKSRRKAKSTPAPVVAPTTTPTKGAK
jgi:hypothetical protein